MTLMIKMWSRLSKMALYIETFKQLIFIRFSSSSPYKKLAPAGYLRGFDFYPKLKFYSVLANAMLHYKKAHGVYPNLVKPQGFSEKVFWFKFFGEVKIPESGNKLLTGHFIPTHMRHLISCPEIVWHAKEPILPKNHELPSGSYYLKASHGSNMFKKIQYPLTDQERAALESVCQQWLADLFGIETGEWWYNSFDKEIFIEKNVSSDEASIALGFFVFSGEIGFVIMVKKTTTATQVNWLDKNFAMMTYQPNKYLRVEDYQLPSNIEHAKSLCCQIGQSFNFVRVDLLMDANEQYYLGEMTFSPGNAMTLRPPEMEAYLGGLWKKLT